MELVQVAAEIKAEGKHAFIANDFETAATKFTVALEYAQLAASKEGKDLVTTLNLNRAIANIKGGNNQEGIDAATSVLNTEGAPSHAKAYYWRATGYYNLKNHKQCLADCAASLKIRPKKNRATRQLYKISSAAQKKNNSAKSNIKSAFSGALGTV